MGKNIDSAKLNTLLYAYSSAFEYGMTYDHPFGVYFGSRSSSQMEPKVCDSMQEAVSAVETDGQASLRVK